MNARLLLATTAVALLIASIGGCKCRYTESAESFDELLESLKNTTDDKLEIAKGIFSDIEMRSPDDLNKTAHLYRSKPYQLVTPDNRTVSNARLAAVEVFQWRLRRYLITKYSQALVAAFEIANIWESTKVWELHAEFRNVYDLPLLRSIYNAAIDEAYNFHGTDVLQVKLAAIHKWSPPNKLVALELLLETQLYLFGKFHQLGDVNNAYLANFAYLLRTVRSLSSFSDLHPTMKARIKRAVKRLPSSLRIFHFEEAFFMSNANSSEFAYMPDAIASVQNGRVVFTRKEPIHYTDAIFSSGGSNQPANAALKYDRPLLFTLRSTKHDMPAYIVQYPDDARLSSSALTATADKQRWLIDLVDDKLVFSTPEGYVMCRSDKKYEAYGYAVATFDDDQHTHQRADCQWVLISNLKV